MTRRAAAHGPYHLHHRDPQAPGRMLQQLVVQRGPLSAAAAAAARPTIEQVGAFVAMVSRLVNFGLQCLPPWHECGLPAPSGTKARITVGHRTNTLASFRR